VIHSYDYPALAALALPAARTYAKIAPGSPHALHMPSHIFTRLGLWDESIGSNLAAAEKARRFLTVTKPGAAAFDELHAIDYLVYAHVQIGEDAKAKALVDKLAAVDGQAIDNANFAAAYAFAAVPARYTLERRKWADAAKLTLRPANFDWKPYAYAEANLHYARAIGAARSGDLNTAKSAVDRLEEIRKELAAQKNTYWAEQTEIQRTASQAWLAQAAGLKDEALRLMRLAADREDKTEKHPVTPGPIIPARELLADMLLENGHPAEALAEMERVLAVSPRRFSGTLLAARAAEAAGDARKAQSHYRELLALAGKTKERPELEQARAFVGK
jgi:predicted Zn-dependent protease